jgi:hypothetical protein
MIFDILNLFLINYLKNIENKYSKNILVFEFEF